MENNISWTKIPLPDDVLRLKIGGYFDDAVRMIDHMIGGFLPECMRKRLELEKEIIRMLGEEEYPFTQEEALNMMKEAFIDFQEDELDKLIEVSGVNWIYIKGKRHFHKLFYDNIVKTRTDYRERLKTSEVEDFNIKRQKLLNDNVTYMKEHGGRTAKMTIRASVKIKKEYEHVGKKVRVYIPIPQKCRQISDIRLLESSPEITVIAPEDALQRTVYFETELKPKQEFFIKYSYINHVNYIEPDPTIAEIDHPDFYMGEQAPHIVFTPFMKELIAEIKGAETNPLIVARKIYDFITTKVMYSFVCEYAALDNISEYAAKNMKGDCGVQAILFITLCRLAGIPARWQSGLYATEMYTGCHDWAEFYIEPYGWLYVDTSFGGSAYRSGQIERWNYYFANLDIYRMVANSEMQSEFMPPKVYFRADPIDNQRGEVEYEDGGLHFSQFDSFMKTVEIEEM
ncbi:transglutaminase domain-containing protein [Lacrimispora amygdalina]|uniref:Transglutaminase domain-containing protein n=1 Tax=Lacrimispora amygdalina TaxID=253257 RepID=A0A3E2N652_9FIRM|nr:transglutaminase domain-containing protein [Clostridium indicum]RFZ76371.1 transglutaminase domain-containing protein [Clostridium indicum]